MATLEGQLKGTPTRKSNLNLPALVGAALVAYLGWAGLQIVDQGKKLTELGLQIVDQGKKLTEQGDKLTRIYQISLPDRLRQAAANPGDRANLKSAQEALTVAIEKNIRIAPDVISDTGKRFVSVAAANPEAWPTVQQYLDYRSFLNADFVPPLTDLTPFANSTYTIMLNLIPRDNLSKPTLAAQILSAGGHTAPENSARLEFVDSRQASSSGVGLLVVEAKSDTLVLDGQYMKNVIVRNSHVAYEGGAVVLENVFFVNCLFEVKPTPRSREFGQALLSAAATTFRTTEPG